VHTSLFTLNRPTGDATLTRAKVMRIGPSGVSLMGLDDFLGLCALSATAPGHGSILDLLNGHAGHLVVWHLVVPESRYRTPRLARIDGVYLVNHWDDAMGQPFVELELVTEAAGLVVALHAYRLTVRAPTPARVRECVECGDDTYDDDSALCARHRLLGPMRLAE
jgi:hypothetical protein